MSVHMQDTMLIALILPAAAPEIEFKVEFAENQSTKEDPRIMRVFDLCRKLSTKRLPISDCSIR